MRQDPVLPWTTKACASRIYGFKLSDAARCSHASDSVLLVCNLCLLIVACAYLPVLASRTLRSAHRVYHASYDENIDDEPNPPKHPAQASSIHRSEPLSS